MRYTIDRARDAEIARQYRALPPMSLERAAEALGIRRGALIGALQRTGTPIVMVGRNWWTKKPPKTKPVEWDPSSRTDEPYPPGHPYTWGLILSLTPSLTNADYPR